MTNHAIKIIDAHHHLWCLDKGQYAWLNKSAIEKGLLGDYTSLCQNYLVPDYQRDVKNYNVEKSVHIQAGYNPAHADAETRFLEKSHTTYGLPSAIVAFTNLCEPTADAMLHKQAQFSLVRGIRQIVNWSPNSYYSGCGKNFIGDPAWCNGYQLLAKHKLRFDLQIYPFQMQDFYRLAKTIETVPVVIEHCGMPLQDKDNNLQLWETQMRQLAQLPYCFVKLSGLGMLGYYKPENKQQAVSIIQKCIDIFGVKRCMFGSNFPVEKLYTTFDELMTFFLSAISGCSTEEKHALFYGNANTIYNIGVTQPLATA